VWSGSEHQLSAMTLIWILLEMFGIRKHRYEICSLWSMLGAKPYRMLRFENEIWLY
jgi:hypothetical protein